MPLIVLCGQPCSGKSSTAHQLKHKLEQLGREVTIIDEPSLHLDRNNSYSNTVNEKNTRATLKSGLERSISKKSFSIVDSLNNIKGYRYELWCIARAAATRYCMVHVDTPIETCRLWNESREGEKYSIEIFEDLAGRFERPDPRNRWDGPLFTVCPECGDAVEVLDAIVHNMTAESERELGNTQQQVSKELSPTVATSNPSLLATNTLHDIDQAAQDVINVIMDAQTAAAGAAAGSISVADQARPLDLAQVVTLAELRRHKRAFLKLATKSTFTRIQDPATARRMFADYLRDNIGT